MCFSVEKDLSEDKKDELNQRNSPIKDMPNSRKLPIGDEVLLNGSQTAVIVNIQETRFEKLTKTYRNEKRNLPLLHEENKGMRRQEDQSVREKPTLETVRRDRQLLL